VISQFPLSIRPLIADCVPISRLDPDFFLATLGLDLLCARLRRTTAPALPSTPFVPFTPAESSDPVHAAANSLVHFDCRFADSGFVRTHCTQFFARQFVNLCSFTDLRELVISELVLDGVSLQHMLPPCLRRLQITKTRLQPSHMREIIAFLESGTLVLLALRETKLGPAGCGLLTDFLKRNEIGELRYIDISSNGVGGGSIEEFLKAAAQTALAGVCVGSNFFSNFQLTFLAETRHSALSVYGMDWDESHVLEFSAALKNPNVCYWDLSAQVVHRHSDPDLTAALAERLLAGCSTEIEYIVLANHQLDRFNLNCIAHVNLKGLSLANSKIEEPTLLTLIPLLDRLVWLDLSCNSVVFRRPTFLEAVAASKTLKTLLLSHNEIGDGNGRTLFDGLQRHQSPLSTLRVRNCGLRTHTSVAVVALLASGVCAFDELDLGGNEMFHDRVPEMPIVQPTQVDYLYIGANGSKARALVQLFGVISDLKFIDLDRTPFAVVAGCAGVIAGVISLSICFTKIATDNEIVQILQETHAHEIWIVHSISQKTFDGLLKRYLDIPLCLGIHVGTDLRVPESPPIPVIVEHVM
jgi:hypothetical protein